jgi:Tol biopolymer transport system component
MWRREQRSFLPIVVALLAVLGACGSDGELAFFEQEFSDSRADLPDILTLCCDAEDATIFVAAGLGEPHASQFPDGPDPEPRRYLAFSLKGVSPADPLQFRWNGPFISDGRKNENAGRSLLPFDPLLDTGEISTQRPGSLTVAATRCDFLRATFTMVVYEFSYLAHPVDDITIVVYRTQERTIEIANSCYDPGPITPPPGDDDLIVFANKPPVLGEDTEIWVMDASGGSRRQLTDNEREDWDPAWSPNRSQIAFVSNSQGDGTHLDLMVMDFDGSDPTQPAVTPLTTFTGQLSARDPAWSPVPGQRKVACASGSAGFFDCIMIFDLAQPAGTPPVEIHTLPQRDIEHLSWSPDGTTIAYCNAGATYVVNADGSTAPTLLKAEQDWSLDWGPMGLVLHRYTGIAQFRLVRTDDMGNNFASVTTGGTHAYDLTPSWSPMSDRIVFVRQQDENAAAQLRVVDPDGDNDVEIPNQPAGSNTEPDWGFGPQP